LPGRPTHKLADVKEGVDEEESGIPQSHTGKHGLKVQVKVFTDTEDDWKKYINTTTTTTTTTTNNDTMNGWVAFQILFSYFISILPKLR
jgi:hypothetical protein